MSFLNKTVHLIIIILFLNYSKSDEPPSLQDYKSYQYTDEQPMVEPLVDDNSTTDQRSFKNKENKLTSSIIDQFSTESQQIKHSSPMVQRSLNRNQQHNPKRNLGLDQPTSFRETNFTPKEKYYDEVSLNPAPKQSSPMNQRSLNRNEQDNPRRNLGLDQTETNFSPKENYYDEVLPPKQSSSVVQRALNRNQQDNPRRNSFNQPLTNFVPKEHFYDEVQLNPAQKDTVYEQITNQDLLNYDDRTYPRHNTAPKARFYDDVPKINYQDKTSGLDTSKFDPAPKVRIYDKDLYEDVPNYAEEELQKDFTVDFRMDIQTQHTPRLANGQLEVAPLEQPPDREKWYNLDDDYQKSAINKRDLGSAQQYKDYEAPQLRHAFNLPMTSDLEVHTDVKKIADSVEKLEEDVKLMLEHITVDQSLIGSNNQLPVARIEQPQSTNPIGNNENNNEFSEKREAPKMESVVPRTEHYQAPNTVHQPGFDEFLQNPIENKDKNEEPALRIDQTNPEKRIYDSLLRENDATNFETRSKKKDPPKTRSKMEIPKVTSKVFVTEKATTKLVEARIDPQVTKMPLKMEPIKIEAVTKMGPTATEKKLIVTKNIPTAQVRSLAQKAQTETVPKEKIIEKEKPKPHPVTRNKKSVENQKSHEQKNDEEALKVRLEKSAETGTKIKNQDKDAEQRNFIDPKAENDKIKLKGRAKVPIKIEPIAEKRIVDPKKIVKRQKPREEDTSSAEDSSTSVEKLKKRYKKTMKSNIFNAYEVQKDFLSYYPSFQRYRIDKRLQRNRYANQHQKRPKGYIPPREFYDITPNRHYPKNGFFSPPEALKTRIQVTGPTAAEGFVKYSQQNYPRPHIFPQRMKPRVPVKDIMSSSSEDSTSEIESTKRMRGIPRNNFPLKVLTNETDKTNNSNTKIKNSLAPNVTHKNHFLKLSTKEPEKNDSKLIEEKTGIDNSTKSRIDAENLTVEPVEKSSNNSTKQKVEVEDSPKAKEGVTATEEKVTKSNMTNSVKSAKTRSKTKSQTEKVAPRDEMKNNLPKLSTNETSERNLSSSKRKFPKIPKDLPKTKVDSNGTDVNQETKIHGELEGTEKEPREKLAKTRLETHSDKNSTITIVQEASFVPIKEDTKTQNAETGSDNFPKKNSTKTKTSTKKISTKKRIEKSTFEIFENFTKKSDSKINIPKKNSGRVRIDKNSAENYTKKNSTKRIDNAAEKTPGEQIKDNFPKKYSAKIIETPKLPTIPEVVPNTKNRIENTTKDLNIPEVHKKVKDIPKPRIDNETKANTSAHEKSSHLAPEGSKPRIQSKTPKIAEKEKIVVKNNTSVHPEKSPKLRTEPLGTLDQQNPDKEEIKIKPQPSVEEKSPNKNVENEAITSGHGAKEPESSLGPKKVIYKEKMNFPLKKDVPIHISNDTEGSQDLKKVNKEKLGFPLKTSGHGHFPSHLDKDVSTNESYKRKGHRKRKPRLNIPRKYLGHPKGSGTKYKLRGSYEEVQKVPKGYKLHGNYDDQSDNSVVPKGLDKDGLKNRIYLGPISRERYSKEIPEVRNAKPTPDVKNKGGEPAGKRDYSNSFSTGDIMKQIQKEFLSRLTKGTKINTKNSNAGMWDGKFLGPVNIFLSPGPQFMLPLSFGKGNTCDDCDDDSEEEKDDLKFLAPLAMFSPFANLLGLNGLFEN